MNFHYRPCCQILPTDRYLDIKTKNRIFSDAATIVILPLRLIKIVVFLVGFLGDQTLNLLDGFNRNTNDDNHTGAA